MTQLLGQVKDYRKLLNAKNKTIGSVIKHYRLERKLTLEDTAKDICSISYLCKVENNQIVPSKTILPNLLKRLKIAEDELKTSYNNFSYQEIIKNKMVPEKLLKQYENKRNYKAKLIFYANAVLNLKDNFKAYKLFIELAKYFSHFTEEEMCFFLYINLLSKEAEEKYLDVLIIANEIYRFKKNNLIIIETKIKELKAYYKLGMEVQINYHYTDTIKLLIEYDRLDLLEYLRSYHIAYKAKLYDTLQLEAEIAKLNNLSDTTINYALFNHYYFKRVDLEKAYYYIDKIKHLNEHYLIMATITLYRLKRPDELLKLINNSKRPVRKSYLKVIEFMLYEKDIIDYIRLNILTARFITDEKIITEFLYKESYKHFKDLYLYKETVAILEKYTAVLKRTISNIAK